ncbi:MAG: glycosyltransferase family 39 protein [Chloroflexi bacterium]|nr:glycosyltransferase family 39 protein [Chloroflexota bacterium]
MRTPLALYLLALVGRLVLIWLHPDPAYPDSAYYADVARSLAEARGFSVDFVWIFAEVGGRIPADPVLPIPSNAHWMPLASIVQVPFLTIFGMNPVAAAVPFALSGALAAPLAWAIGREAGASRVVSVGAGILTAFPALSFPFMVQTDNFSLYQPLVAGALFLGARGLKGHARSFALGGLLVGLATLARNDGVLAGGVLALAFLWDRWRAWRSSGSRRPAIPVWSAVACAGLFVAVMAPWVARQLVVFGSISPSSASGKVLFIRSIEEWNQITSPATLDHLLGMGLGPLLLTRVGGLVAAVGIFTTLVGAGLLVPPMLIGALRRRRSVDFGPFFGYAAALFAFSAIVSAIHVPGGTFIHSAVALVPHGYVLALEGTAVGVAWIAARRRTWNREDATHVFSGATVAIGIVAALVGTVVVDADWNEKRQARLTLAAALDIAGAAADDRLLTIDAAGYRYLTGRGGVVTTNDSIETQREIATAYRTAWLVLERDEIATSMAPVLRGDSRPSWIGAPVFTIPGTDGGPPRIALYPICLSDADRRCSVVATADFRDVTP